MECRYCKNDFNKFGIKNHEDYCTENLNKKSRSGINNPHFGKKGKNQYSDGTLMPKSIRKKIGLKLKDVKLKDSHKLAISKGMQSAVRNNPNSYSSSNINGRVKKVKYKNITLDSSWELKFAKWLDKNNIKWSRPENGFEYQWNGLRIYYPDFYLPELDFYIEVKGYIRERDYFKWASIPNILIISKKEIKLIEENKAPLAQLVSST